MRLCLMTLRKKHKGRNSVIKIRKKEYLSLLNQYLKSYEKYIYCNQIGMLLFDEEKYCRNGVTIIVLKFN